jgi:hypothetical protein
MLWFGRTPDISYLFFKCFITSSRCDSWSWVSQSPQKQILMCKIFQHMIKTKIDLSSHLVAFQRDLNTGPDLDIAEVVMRILDFLILSISFDFLRVISGSFFFRAIQRTVPEYDQIRDRNDTKLLLLLINDCINLEHCFRSCFAPLDHGELR